MTCLSARAARAALVALLAGALVTAVPACASAAESARWAAASVTGQSSVIVGVADGASMSGVEAALVASGGRIRKVFAWRAFLVTVPTDSDSAGFSATVRRIPGVRYSEGNSTLRALGTANDPLFPSQWGLPDIHAPEAWDSSEGSGVSIAELDTGIDYTHPDLTRNVRSFYDYVNNDTDAMDDSGNGHGTHVAGILAAERNNHAFIAGTAPKATVYAFKILDNTGSGTIAGLVTAMRDAVDKTPCRIITMSLGQAASETLPEESVAMNDAVAHVRSKGALLVAAAGNAGSSAAFYPAALPGVLAVGSVDSTNTRSSFSNYGIGHVDLVAPGQGILSTLRNSTAGQLSGTSMATPFVAASAALVWAARPSLDATAVELLLESTAQDLGDTGLDPYYGYGLVRPDLALAALPVESSVTIASSASRTRLATPFVLSGVLTPAGTGDLVVAYARKPGSARWSYSSARLTYASDGQGGGRWWYRYTPRLRGRYSFYAAGGVVAGGGPARSTVVAVSIF